MYLLYHENIYELPSKGVVTFDEFLVKEQNLLQYDLSNFIHSRKGQGEGIPVN